MPETSLERVGRVLDLIPYIQKFPGITTEDLAEEFNISQEQLLNDLNLLFVCGLPGKLTMDMIDLAFDDGRVSIIDSQGLDTPRRLTRSELVSLIAGLEMLLTSDFFNPAARIRASRLKEKLSRGLHGSILVHSIPDREGLPHAELILTAIKDKKWLLFMYTSGVSDRISQRKVQPLNVIVEGEHTYLTAFDIDLNQIRHFRLDRMDSVKMVDSERSIVIQDQKSEQDVTLLVADQARSFIEENPQIVLASHRVEDGHQVICRIQHTEWLIRRMLAYGGSIRILAPASLRLEIQERAREILALYS
jgi:proteasome accessory factor C